MDLVTNKDCCSQLGNQYVRCQVLPVWSHPSPSPVILMNKNIVNIRVKVLKKK